VVSYDEKLQETRRSECCHLRWARKRNPVLDEEKVLRKNIERGQHIAKAFFRKK